MKTGGRPSVVLHCDDDLPHGLSVFVTHPRLLIGSFTSPVSPLCIHDPSSSLDWHLSPPLCVRDPSSSLDWFIPFTCSPLSLFMTPPHLLIGSFPSPVSPLCIHDPSSSLDWFIFFTCLPPLCIHDPSSSLDWFIPFTCLLPLCIHDPSSSLDWFIPFTCLRLSVLLTPPRLSPSGL